MYYGITSKAVSFFLFIYLTICYQSFIVTNNSRTRYIEILKHNTSNYKINIYVDSLHNLEYWKVRILNQKGETYSNRRSSTTVGPGLSVQPCSTFDVCYPFVRVMLKEGFNELTAYVKTELRALHSEPICHTSSEAGGGC